MTSTRRDFLQGGVATLAATLGMVCLPGFVRKAAALDIERKHVEAEECSQRVRDVVDEVIRQERIVGAVVLVSQEGQSVCSHAAGFLDREAGLPMQENAIFRLASVSKLIVSVAAMLLVEQGKMRLTDPVTNFLPAFTPRLSNGTTPVITIKHLLTHTAGLRYGFGEGKNGRYHKANVSTGLDQPGLSMEENLHRIASVPLDYVPGTQWGYSVATDVLGAAMSAACQEPLQALVRRLVTVPLGMKDTSFSVTDRTRLAKPYMDGKPRPLPMPMEAKLGTGEGLLFSLNRIHNSASFPSGGAGMAGTAPDIMRLVNCLCYGGSRLMSPSTMTAMNSQQVAPHEVEPGWGFGLGWSVLVDPQKTQTPQGVGTAKWGGVYGHSWFFDPSRKLSVVALTNTSLAGMTGRFPMGVRNAAYGVSL